MDFNVNKLLNVGYFDEDGRFTNIMEYGEDDVYFEDDEITKEYIIMNSTIDKLWAISFGRDMNELFVTIKEDKEKE
jgi:hypothetical protein